MREIDRICSIKAALTGYYKSNDKTIHIVPTAEAEFDWTLETLTETDLVILDNSES